jgi:hypothetical protein
MSASTRSADQGRAVLHQVCDAIAAKTGLTGQRRRSDTSFSLTRSNTKSGIQSASGELEDDVIKIRIEIAHVPSGTLAEVVELCTHIAQLVGTKIRVDNTPTGHASLVGELVVSASLLNLARQSALEAELQRLQDLAAAIQTRHSGKPLNSALDEKYAAVSSFLARIPGVEVPAGSEIHKFVVTAADYLESGLTLAAHGEASLVLQYVTAAIAAEAERRGTSLGRFTPGTLTFKMIPSILPRAPGWLMVSALQLAVSSDAFQISDDAAVALGQLHRQGLPLLITGGFEELQNVFARGQGLRANPLEPLVLAVPDIEIGCLAKFAALAAAEPVGGLTRAAETEVIEAVLAAASGLPQADALRVMQPVASQAVQRWKRGSLRAGVTDFANQLAGQSATLAGFSAPQARQRCEELQTRLTRIAVAADPADFLRAGLFGQSAALTEMGARLRKEILTRPPHQPIRWMAQGPASTGKSESLKLLAQYLGLHHEFIDASGFSDAYTAASQLLGSGRGLVGSNRMGRLEQASQHRPGVIVEVADLDHAHPTVRTLVADLFLKALDEGEADSATGKPFGLSNLLIAFTVNVDGEERLRRGVGFNSERSREEITARTIETLVTQFSPAFIDRVGSPIVFEALDNAALVAIAQREAVSDFRRAAERLGHTVDEVHAADDLGKALVLGFQQLTSNPGARGLKEHVRQQIAEAVAIWHRVKPAPGPFYLLTTNQQGKILIEKR